MPKTCDALVTGAGVVGLSTGIALLQGRPSIKVMVADKEKHIGRHASGRNSGVIHAGFYYSPDSLKAKFYRDGNFELRKLAKKYEIPVKNVGKVVVARNEDEDSRLNILFERGIANGVELELHPEEKLKEFKPLAITHNRFMWSPNTGISDSISIVKAMRDEFLALGGEIHFDSKVHLTESNGEIYVASGQFTFRHVVNAAGAQADRISRSVGVGSEYAMLPFMGIYRATSEKNLPLQRLVYPVPHPINPFLGVHFTLTIDGKLKIGPTAIPIAGREQYSLIEGWSGPDIAQALKGIKALATGSSHDFGAILKSEWPKIVQKLLVKESAELVPSAIRVRDWYRKPPGIRAQLVHLPTGKLEQDFIVNNRLNSTHILNAVSPGWTSSIPFGRMVAQKVFNPTANSDQL
jgi:L-2-hydroxyglutarate oxidase